MYVYTHNYTSDMYKAHKNHHVPFKLHNSSGSPVDMSNYPTNTFCNPLKFNIAPEKRSSNHHFSGANC